MNKRVECHSCKGRGFHNEPRDLHRSGGVSTCDYCAGSGLIDTSRLPKPVRLTGAWLSPAPAHKEQAR